MRNKGWEAATFNSFCKWLKNDVNGEITDQIRNSDLKIERYGFFLADTGLDLEEIKKQQEFIKATLFKIDIQKWNKEYAKNISRQFIYSPNLFMTGIIEKIPAGRVLDVGMGQGRNLLYLARKGWIGTGLEASKEGYEIANRTAQIENLDVSLVLTNFENYDFGKNKWDLILLLYVPLREIVSKVVEGLSVNGSLIVEAFHEDSLQYGSFGDKVTFRTNELLTLFEKLVVYNYSEKSDFSDFGQSKLPIVRLHAGKTSI